MKLNKVYIALVGLFSLLVFNACVDEIDIAKGDVVEGVYTDVKLSFSSDDLLKIETKSELATEEEYKVANLYVFVFNANTKVKEFGQLFTSTQDGGLVVEDSKISETDGKQTKGYVTFKTTSGEKLIYAVANVPTAYSLMSLSKGLDNVANFSDLQNLTASMRVNTTGRDQGYLLMSGFLENSGNGGTEGYCQIQPSTGTVDLSTIKLDRLDSKITFKVKSGKDNIDFKLQQYKVFNVPQKASLLPGQSFTKSDDDYLAMPEGFVNYETESNGARAFTFYVLENLNETTSLSGYNERELEEKNADGTNSGVYVYAPKYGTFVEMTGTYFETYSENGLPKERSAEVKYTVHLGYCESVNGSKANDFNTKRNTSYTYNVTVMGVDKIKLEVSDDREEEPGAEGHVVETDKFYQFDAHYGVDLITFPSGAANSRASFRIETPFSKGELKYNNGNWEGDSKDFEWIKFARNVTRTQRGVTTYREDQYRLFSETTGTTAATGKLLTVKELVEDLLNGNPYLSNKAVYTMYIDEYYYDKDPVTGNADLTLWKKFVNQPNRVMHILCDTEYSDDEESSLTTSSIMISQRSIKTFYNVDDSSLSSAFGIETDNETSTLSRSTNNPWSTSGLTNSNGRYNLYRQINSGSASDKWSWDTYISNTYHGTGYFLKDANSSSANNTVKVRHQISACLQRNQDTNKNGTIEPSELKWYPAAINQYTDIWMGTPGLPTETHLHPSGYTTGIRRYLSSSGGNSAEFFAEEASSIGGYGFSYSTGVGRSDSNHPEFQNKYDYRCIRNLGVSKTVEAATPSSSSEYQDYVSVSSASGTYTFSLPYLSASSLRSNPATGELALHDEYSSANRPFKKFVLKSEIAATSRLLFINMNRAASPCEKYNVGGESGWRIPNQREISLILRSKLNNSISLDIGSYMWSRTYSSLSWKLNSDGSPNHGYGATNSIISLPEGSNGLVRCVKDIE